MKPYFETALLSLLVCILLHPSVAQSSDSFREELIINPIQNGKILNHFQFITNGKFHTKSDFEVHHYQLISKSLGDVVLKFQVRELHLSLTQGLWRYESWGIPINAAPPGAQLWVWFKESVEDVDKSWNGLVNALSGLICASLNFMNQPVVPQYSFRPTGVAPENLNSSLLRYAALPRENVCTENLTPWLKLLPCLNKAGLGTLLRAPRIFDTSYHSLGIHVRPVCPEQSCTQPDVEFRLTADLVFDPTLEHEKNRDWSLRSLFGMDVFHSCPVADSSLLFVDVTSNKTVLSAFELNPEPQRIHEGSNRLGVYDMTQLNSTFKLTAKYKRDMVMAKVKSPILSTHRYITGYGQYQGGIAVQLSNHHSKSISVVYMEVIPWFLRVYLHTLKIKGPAGDIKPAHVLYVPAQDRVRHALIETVITLPAESTVTVEIAFDRAFLKWTEYPPDANHGFYIPSAIISAYLPQRVHDLLADPSGKSSFNERLNDVERVGVVHMFYTEALLVSLPTPDFSMPYNVICLACTVVAIAFGSIHNLTTRSFRITDPKKPRGILSKIRGFFQRDKSEPPATAGQDGGSEASKKKSE